METLIEAFVDFIKLRQLNIALGILFTVIYFVYQYRDVLFTKSDEEPLPSRSSRRISRSKSRSRSRSRSRGPSYYKVTDKHRRGRKIKRCPDCSKCNSEQEL